MEPDALKKAFRNGWILVALVTLFFVAFFVFTLAAAKDAPKPGWDMGGVPFVPASSTYGNDYHTSAPNGKGEAER
jgi:hypothetical protein